MMFLGVLEEFETELTSSIELGIFNNDIKPFFNFSGKYIQHFWDDSKEMEGKIAGVIDEIICDREPDFSDQKGIIYEGDIYKYLIIRHIKEKNKISLVYLNDGKIKLWTPTFEEIFKMIKMEILGGRERFNSDYKYRNGQFYRIIKEIHQQIRSNMQLDIASVLRNNRYSGNEILIFHNDNKTLNVSEGALYSLIKSIMISEDKRFCELGQMGSDMLYLAIVEYIKYFKTWEEVRDKYNLKERY